MEKERMMRQVGRLRFTFLGAGIGAVVVFFSHQYQLQFSERIVQLFQSMEEYQVDELALALLIFFFGYFIDALRSIRSKKRQTEIHQQRLRVLKATMTTVQDIMNNFLNGLVLFRIQAIKKNELSPQSFDRMDSLIRDTAQKLKALSDLEDTPEKHIAEGKIGIDYERKPPIPSCFEYIPEKNTNSLDPNSLN
jgi:hypothetical protein